MTAGMLLDRIRGAAAALARRPPAAPTPPAPRSGPPRTAALVPFARDGQPARPVLLAAVQGLGPAELERVIVTAQASAAAADVHVLFLTDSPELMLFRSRNALVEHLPTAGELACLASREEAEIYLARRLALLCRKWRPVRIIPYGEAAASWLGEVLRLPDAVELAPLAGVVAVEGEPGTRSGSAPASPAPPA